VRHLPLGAVCPSGADNATHPFSWLRFCYVLMGYSRPRKPGDDAPEQWFYHAAPAVRLARQNPHAPAESQRQANNWRDLYWSCDRLQVTLARTQTRHAMQVTAKPFQTQFFSGCEARVDGGKPRRIGTDFEWVLHAGENCLELAALNKLGARGHPWRAVLHKSPLRF
jgi:hypothetical protein